MLGVALEQVGQLLFTRFPFAFDVLDHEDVEAVSQGAKGQPQSRGRLPFAVACHDHDQAAPSLTHE